MKKIKKIFFNSILDVINGTKAYDWLEFVIHSKENAYRSISQRYDKDKEELEKDLIIASKAINSLPF